MASRSDIIICAHNEQKTIGPVLEAVGKSDYVNNVIVVADGCTDDTASVALNYTSTVLPTHFVNKGSAMAYGLGHVRTPYVGFCDADISGLTSDHVDELLAKECSGQTAGLFEWNTFFSGLPPITGQRCVPTWVAENATLFNSGWEAEHRINTVVARYGLPWKHFTLVGVKHPSKIEEGQLAGWAKEMSKVGSYSVRHLPDLVKYVGFPEGRRLYHAPSNGRLNMKA